MSAPKRTLWDRYLSRWAEDLLIWRLALRNTRLHRARTFLLGAIFGIGTLFSVIASAVVDSMDARMAQGIIESMAGHLQIYSADARDPLALYGDEFVGVPDIGSLQDFSTVAAVVRAMPEVKAVVPMGSTVAYVSGEAPLDAALEALSKSPADTATRDEVQRLLTQLEQDLQGAAHLSTAGSEAAEKFATARKAASQWPRDFAQDPAAAIEYLENRVAPMQAEQQRAGLWLVGTDIPAFSKAFKRFKVVRGRAPEVGERGLLLNDAVYEKQLRNRVARDLEALDKAQQAGDPRTERRERLPELYQEVLTNLQMGTRPKLKALLAEYLEHDGTLVELMRQFLTFEAKQTAERRAFFDTHIAPLLHLYRPAVGEVATAKTLSQMGFSNAVNVKIVGTFTFTGMEKTPISQGHTLIDLASFRDLYGAIDQATRDETAAMRKAAGVKDVSRDDAEAMFFDGPAEVEVVTERSAPIEVKIKRVASAGKGYDPETLEQGLALHAAVHLKAGFHSPEAIQAAAEAVQKALDGAGIQAQVVNWREASGMVGQLTLVARMVLGIVALVMAIVTLVVINNAMVLATQERAKEIGTIRAIGGTRGFVVRLFTAETVVLGVIAGGIGAIFGAIAVWAMAHWGIPAVDPFTTFLFSGERLYPVLEAGHLISAIINVVVIGALSTAWPAFTASRVKPAEAMA